MLTLHWGLLYLNLLKPPCYLLAERPAAKVDAALLVNAS